MGSVMSRLVVSWVFHHNLSYCTVSFEMKSKGQCNGTKSMHAKRPSNPQEDNAPISETAEADTIVGFLVRLVVKLP